MRSVYGTILVFLACEAVAGHFHYRDPRLPTFLLGRPPGGFLEAGLRNSGDKIPLKATYPNLQKFTFEQPIDHWNTSLGKWQQRVQYNPTYDAKKELIFLMIGGESPATDKWAAQSNYTYIRWAAKYGAAIYQLEHRFFGWSRPYNDMSTSSLRYCTTKQALEDLAVFIKAMNKKNGYKNPKWVTFGGSYPGALNAWFRAKYPELTVGAVASSAPLNLKLDFYEYAIVVEDTLRRTDPNCRDKVANAFSLITKKTITTAGRTELNNAFNLDPPFNDTSVTVLDLQNFVANLFGVFQGVIQYTYDARGVENFNGLDATNLCLQVTNASYANDPLKQIRAVIDWVNSFYPTADGSNKFANSYSDMIKVLANTTFDDENDTDNAAARGWMWLCCNEIGYLQTTDAGRGAFGNMVPLNYYIDMCTGMFGDSINIETIRDSNAAAQKYYGGADKYNATNVILPNGSLDPWHALGTYHDIPEQHLRTILIDGTAHCADMYAVWDKEPTALAGARDMIEKELQYYISYVEPPAPHTTASVEPLVFVSSVPSASAASVQTTTSVPTTTTSSVHRIQSSAFISLLSGLITFCFATL